MPADGEDGENCDYKRKPVRENSTVRRGQDGKYWWHHQSTEMHDGLAKRAVRFVPIRRRAGGAAARMVCRRKLDMRSYRVLVNVGLRNKALK